MSVPSREHTTVLSCQYAAVATHWPPHVPRISLLKTHMPYEGIHILLRLTVVPQISLLKTHMPYALKRYTHPIETQCILHLGRYLGVTCLCKAMRVSLCHPLFTRRSCIGDEEQVQNNVPLLTMKGPHSILLALPLATVVPKDSKSWKSKIVI